VVANTEPDIVAVEVPLAFVAVTLYVYEVPDASPVIVSGEDPDALKLLGLDTAL
jgi:hypothetical protein